MTLVRCKKPSHMPAFDLSKPRGRPNSCSREGIVNFDPTASFEDNLAIFRAEVDGLDLECARILFDNLATLSREGDAARSRQAIQEFHRAVLAAVEALPDTPAP